MIEECKIGTIGYVWDYEDDDKKPCVLMGVCDLKEYRYVALFFNDSDIAVSHFLHFKPSKATRKHTKLVRFTKELKAGLAQYEK